MMINGEEEIDDCIWKEIMNEMIEGEFENIMVEVGIDGGMRIFSVGKRIDEWIENE